MERGVGSERASARSAHGAQRPLYNAWKRASSIRDSARRIIIDSVRLAQLACVTGMPRYIDAATAARIDEHLMASPGVVPSASDPMQSDVDGPGFTLEQLMELAGLACAMTVQRCYPPASHPRVLICAGPGNQGGDGLVAARHLVLFGYAVTLYWPKGEDKLAHYGKLWRQASHTGVKRIDSFDESVISDADVILDAVFGFSFKGQPRAPFDAVLAAFKQTSTPIVSVDIPSGALAIGRMR